MKRASTNLKQTEDKLNTLVDALLQPGKDLNQILSDYANLESTVKLISSYDDLSIFGISEVRAKNIVRLGNQVDLLLEDAIREHASPGRSSPPPRGPNPKDASSELNIQTGKERAVLNTNRKKSPRPSVLSVFEDVEGNAAKELDRVRSESLIIPDDDINCNGTPWDPAATINAIPAAQVKEQQFDGNKWTLKMTILHARGILRTSKRTLEHRVIVQSSGTRKETRWSKGTDPSWTQTFLFLNFAPASSSILIKLQSRMKKKRSILKSKKYTDSGFATITQDTVDSCCLSTCSQMFLLPVLSAQKNQPIGELAIAMQVTKKQEDTAEIVSRRKRGVTQISNYLGRKTVERCCVANTVHAYHSMCSKLGANPAVREEEAEDLSDGVAPPDEVVTNCNAASPDFAKLEEWVENAPPNEWGGIQLPTVQWKNRYGQTILHLLVLGDCEDGVRRILQMKPSLSATDQLGMTPLHIAVARNSSIQLIHQLITAAVSLSDASPEILDAGPGGLSALAMCVISKNIEAMMLLIEHGCNINIVDSGGCSIASIAAWIDNLPAIEIVAKFNGALDMEDAELYTPFLIAVLQKNKEIATYLLEKGADVNAISLSGRTALWIAITRNMPELLETILNHPGLDLEMPLGHHRFTLMMRVIFELSDKECCKIIPKLLAHGAQLSSRNDEGKTCFFMACNRQKSETLQILLKAAEHLPMGERSKLFVDAAGNSPLFFVGNNVYLAEALTSAGCSASLQNKQGNTAMHVASGLRHMQMVQYLNSLGVVGVKNANGNTPSEVTGCGVDIAMPFFLEDTSLKEFGGIKVKDGKKKRKK